MSDWSELKRLAEAAGDPDRAIDENDYGDEIWFGGYGCGMIEVGKWINGGQKKDPEKWSAIKADAEFIAAATPSVVLALINENTSLKGSCKALGGRHLRYLERYIRVVERKNAKHVANRNEFVSCMERKGEEIDNLKADNKALLEALEAFVNDIAPNDVNDPLWVAGRAAIETARNTAAK